MTSTLFGPCPFPSYRLFLRWPFAEAIYLDLFEDGWANGIHQKFIDTYFDASYTVEEQRYLLKAA